MRPRRRSGDHWLEGTMSLSYHEGDWFTVPLRRAGYAVGLVARLSEERPVTLDQSQ